MTNDSNRLLQRSWMRLSEALTDVKSMPLSEGDAKRFICNAIADLKIKVQLGLLRHATRHATAHGKRVLGANVDIPADLEPQHLDFENSRPLGTWFVRREQKSYTPGRWEFDWIELDREDLAKLVRSIGVAVERRPLQPRRKAQTAREGARRAVLALFPNGNPDQVTVPNTNLCKCVGAKMKEMGLPNISDDTILRAAGRRK